VVIVVAPISEEVFFRGFFYGALRNRLGVVWATVISAALFGAIHITSSDTLPLIPVLALLGAILCLLYEKTGSLYPCIALHAVNNAIAYAVPEDAPDGAEYVSLALLPLMLAACLLAPRLAPGRQAAAGAGLP
jgi:membrane protease YdiL (CAAX protease family)